MRLNFLLPLLFLFAPVLCAERIMDFNDTVFLHDYETVRYRIPIEYGSAPNVSIRVYVRGLGAPPRARLLNADFGKAREVRERSGDGIIDFTHSGTQARYYLEVDSNVPSAAGDFEIRVQIDAEDGTGATAQVQFVKYFTDYENDGHGCSTGESTGLFAALLALVFGLWLWRRRELAQAWEPV
jgi:MYXO-CTERM domain-containing protein